MAEEQRKDPLLRDTLSNIATKCLPEDSNTAKLLRDLVDEKKVHAHGISVPASPAKEKSCDGRSRKVPTARGQ